MFWLYVKPTCNVVMLLIGLAFVVYSYLAYYDKSVKQYLVILIINTMVTIYRLRNCVILIIISIIGMYFPLLISISNTTRSKTN